MQHTLMGMLYVLDKLKDSLREHMELKPIWSDLQALRAGQNQLTAQHHQLQSSKRTAQRNYMWSHPRITILIVDAAYSSSEV
jgi:hypothetical protein